MLLRSRGQDEYRRSFPGDSRGIYSTIGVEIKLRFARNDADASMKANYHALERQQLRGEISTGAVWLQKVAIYAYGSAIDRKSLDFNFK